MSRDLRKYTQQTHFRLIIGGHFNSFHYWRRVNLSDLRLRGCPEWSALSGCRSRADPVDPFYLLDNGDHCKKKQPGLTSRLLFRHISEILKALRWF